jgi:hypothetical protein
MRTRWLAALALAVPALLSAQASRPDAPGSPLARIVVMGASLSAGLGAERDLAAALEASLRAPRGAPVDLGEVLFFVNPVASGAKQVEAALEAEPTLVVALDFLFWFGYGSIDAGGGPIEAEAERLELLERGLALLAALECPLVVADFPDMSGAVGRVLVQAQVPAEATLAQLSRRVREWAGEREHTIVLPLAEIVARLAAQQELRVGRRTFAPGARLLQEDRLHPTLEGLAAMAQLVGDELVRRGLGREEEFEPELDALLAKLGERARPRGVGMGTRR